MTGNVFAPQLILMLLKYYVMEYRWPQKTITFFSLYYILWWNKWKILHDKCNHVFPETPLN